MPEPVGPVTRNRPRGPADQLLADRRQADLLEGEQLVGDQTQHDRRCRPAGGRPRRGSGPRCRRRSRSRSCPPPGAPAGPAPGVIDFIRATQSSESSTLVSRLRSAPCRRSVGLRPTRQVQVGGALPDHGVEQVGRSGRWTWADTLRATGRASGARHRIQAHRTEAACHRSMFARQQRLGLGESGDLFGRGDRRVRILSLPSREQVSHAAADGRLADLRRPAPG